MKVPATTRTRLTALKTLTLSAAKGAHNAEYEFQGAKLTALVEELLAQGYDVLDICDAQNGK